MVSSPGLWFDVIWFLKNKTWHVNRIGFSFFFCVFLPSNNILLKHLSLSIYLQCLSFTEVIEFIFLSANNFGFFNQFWRFLLWCVLRIIASLGFIVQLYIVILGFLTTAQWSYHPFGTAVKFYSLWMCWGKYITIGMFFYPFIEGLCILYDQLIFFLSYYYSGEIIHISPADSNFSWNLLTMDGNNIVASNNKCSIHQYFWYIKVEKHVLSFFLVEFFCSFQQSSRCSSNQIWNGHWEGKDKY